MRYTLEQLSLGWVGQTGSPGVADFPDGSVTVKAHPLLGQEVELQHLGKGRITWAGIHPYAYMTFDVTFPAPTLGVQTWDRGKRYRVPQLPPTYAHAEHRFDCWELLELLNHTSVLGSA